MNTLEIIQPDRESISIDKKAAYLSESIAGYFELAKTDYVVDGGVISVDTDPENDIINVTVIENGELIKTELSFVSDYTARQIYNIWMETF